MKTWEKALVAAGFVYTIPLVLSPVVAPQRLIWLWRQPHGPVIYLALLAIGFALTIAGVVVALRDFLERTSTDSVSVLWFAVLVVGGAPGAFVYLLRHGRRPRTKQVADTPEGQARTTPTS